MSSNPSLYRYVDFIGGNILDASNVTLLQTILEGRSASAVNGITGMAQLFAQGTLLNCVFNISGSTIVMTYANPSYPIYVLVNDRFESLGNTVTIAGSQPGSGIVNLYLNSALVRALRPGGADLGLTDEHAVGRGVVVGAVGLPLALSAPRSVSAALDGLQHFPPVSARRGVAADLGGVAPGPARTTGPRGQPNRRHHR